MHSSVIGKIEKAHRYARERDRITVERLAVTFAGDNDSHHLILEADGWQCNCHYFEVLEDLRPHRRDAGDPGRDAARGAPDLALPGVRGNGRGRRRLSGAGDPDSMSWTSPR